MTNAQAESQTADASTHPHSLSNVFDRLLENIDGNSVTVDTLLRSFSNRSFGPLLLVPSLLALGPTGAIPGMSIAMGLVIVLIAVQMLLFHGRPWLPERVRNFSFPRESLEKGIRSARPYASSLERWIKPRLTFLTQTPWSYAMPLVSIVLALTLFPLAVIPFGVAPPAAALTLLSIGLTMRDGYVLIAGYALAAISVMFVLQFV